MTSTMVMEQVPDVVPVCLGEVVKPPLEVVNTTAEHVENIQIAAAENHIYLPEGIAMTEDETHSHWFIGSVDCGTTSSRFLIFNGEGNPIASHQIEFENLYPQSG